jgi:hypothetical protein
VCSNVVVLLFCLVFFLHFKIVTVIRIYIIIFVVDSSTDAIDKTTKDKGECWLTYDTPAYMFNVYKNQLSRQTGSRNLTGPKTLMFIVF